MTRLWLLGLTFIAGAVMPGACSGEDDRRATPAQGPNAVVERSATAGPVDGTPASGLDGTPGPAATASLDPVPTPAPEPPPPAPAGGRAALWSGQAEGPGFPWLAYRVTPGDNPDTDPWLFESGPLVSGPLDLKRFSCRPEPQEGGLRLSQCTGLPDGIDFAAFVEDGGDRRMTVTLIGQRRGGTLRRNASLTAVEERAEPPVTADVSLLWRHDETSSFGQHTDIWAADGIVFAPHDSGRIEVLDAATGAPLAVIDARAVQGGTPPGPLSVTDVKARDGLLYAATAGAGLLIFDVRAPSAPQLVGQYIVWVAPQSPENFVDVHNIFMSPGGEIVYAINQSHPQSDLRLIDVSDPASPREAGRFVIPTARTLLEGAHDVNVVEFDERLIAFMNTLRSGLLILEVTDPAAIRMLGSIAWEGIFSHSGWPFRAGDRLYYAHTEEGFDRGMTVLDVTDLSAPRAVSRFVTRAGISVHNVEVVEGFAYLSYYIDGLRVLDLRDPANPREIGRFDTVPANEERGIAQGAWGVHVTDGVVFISDVEEGIYALKVGTLGAATDSNRHQPVRVLSPMSLVRRPNRQRKAACARRRGRGAHAGVAILPELDRSGTAGRSPGEVTLRGARLAHHIVDVLADGQAADVVLLDLSSLSAFTDYFVIATVDNVRQMRAIIDALAEQLERVTPDVSGREEGTVDSGWVLFDLGDVVVHLLSLERRAYYDLEELWSTAREVVRIQ